MSDTDYIQVWSTTGTTVGLERASLIIEPLRDGAGNHYIALADDYDTEHRKPWLVTHEDHPNVAGIEKQYGWYFETVVTEGVEPEDFMRYRNVDQRLEVGVNR